LSAIPAIYRGDSGGAVSCRFGIGAFPGFSPALYSNRK
jgi:hypothetical protein